MSNETRIETSDLIERYLTYKLVIEGRSEKTVDEYRLDLRQFFRFIVAKRQKISPESEEYEQLSIAEVDGEFVKKKTFLIYMRTLFYLIIPMEKP